MESFRSKMLEYDEKMQDCMNESEEASAERRIPIAETVQNLMAEKSAECERLLEAAEVDIKVCIFGDEIHIEEAKKLNLSCMDENELRPLFEDSKFLLLQDLANKFDFFMASEKVLQKLPESFLDVLNRAGKAPMPLSHDDNMAEKVAAVKNSRGMKLMNLMSLLCMDGAHAQST